MAYTMKMLAILANRIPLLSVDERQRLIASHQSFYSPQIEIEPLYAP